MNYAHFGCPDWSHRGGIVGVGMGRGQWASGKHGAGSRGFAGGLSDDADADSADERAEQSGAGEVCRCRDVVEDMTGERSGEQAAGRVLQVHPLEIALPMEDRRRTRPAERGAPAMDEKPPPA